MSDEEAAGTEGESSPSERKWKFFTTVALKGSAELRALLPLSETQYQKLAREAQPDARAYFMYCVLDSVYEAGVAMMRWEDLVKEDQPLPDDIHTRLVTEAIGAEGALWTRRLIEALTMLICFSTTNDEPYYRHWLLLDELDDVNHARKDQRDYFACDSKSLTLWITKTIASIRTVERQIDLSRSWYLKERRPLAADPRPGLFSSFAANLRTAIPNARPREWVLLGLSYQQFSRVSESIHFSPPNLGFSDRENDIRSYFGRCWLIVQAILLRVIELNKLTPTGLCAQLERINSERDSDDENAKRFTSNRAKVGDIVVVGGGLARVTAVNRSTYGYESYTVHYIEGPPAPDVHDDDVLPFHVRRLFEAERVKQMVLDLLKQHHPDSKLSDAERLKNIEETFDESAREAWNLGLREYVFGASRRARSAGGGQG
jgi:hypothetical protein